jgi:hypothetical protein
MAHPDALMPPRPLAPPISRSTRAIRRGLLASGLALAVAASVAATSGEPPAAPEHPLAEYFGFEGLEIVPVGPKAGPMLAADVDGDGLLDLIVVNNHRSRIELFRQKPGASPDDPVPPPSRPNELPDHWRFERSFIPVGHEVGAIAAWDFDGDGRLDLAYAGQPGTIVLLRQVSPGSFEVARRMPVRGLASGRDGLAIANLLGDSAPELLAIVNGRLTIWPVAEGFRLGEPMVLTPGTGSIAGFFIEDLDGDGSLDLVGVIPEDPAPLRVWLARREATGRLALGPQLRFELPALRRAAAVRIPGEAAARVAAIDRASGRLAVLGLEGDGHSAATGAAAIEFFGFEDPTARKRSVAIADIDGDGRLDLVATHVEANSIVLYRQEPGRGFVASRSFPGYAEMEGLAAADLDGSGPATLLLLSEREGVVGRSRWDGESLPFPQALPLSPGHVPVTVASVETARGRTVAVVGRKDRTMTLDLISPDGAVESVPLGELGRPPAAILELDADGDGWSDLLLLTPERPMIMLRGTASGWKRLDSAEMGQFGLVQAAAADNTAVMDFNGDGREELLVADRNFVRALRYEESPAEGRTPGWQVVGQLNADRSDSRLVSLAVLPGQVVAADRANSRLVIFSREEGALGTAAQWRQSDSIDLAGFRVRSIFAGEFSPSAGAEILVVADDGFAVVRLAGGGARLAEAASWRSEDPRAFHHDLLCGDLNADAFSDLVLANAGTQSLDLLSFAADGRLLPALSFPIYDTRIFSGGEVREFEPRQMAIADLTGDGLFDLVLICHDRVLLYPQQPPPGGLE